MKYHSTPKPVRIRFVSGGEEHFSLDTFLDNFNPADIIGKKNELLRWLDLQGENGSDIKERLQDIELERKNLLAIYKAFYYDKKIDDLADLFRMMPEKSKNLRYLKDVCYNDASYLEALYSGQKTHKIEKDDDWFVIIKNYVENTYLVKREGSLIEWSIKKEVDHPRLIHFLGNLYYERNKDIECAKQCYEIAKALGVKSSQKKLEELEKEADEYTIASRPNRFDDVNQSLITDIILFIVKNFKRYQWKNRSEAFVSYCHDYKNIPVPSLTSLEREILSLVVLSCNLKNIKSNAKPDSSISLKYKYGIEFFKTMCEDNLFFEKDFILSLIGSHPNEPEDIKKAANDKMKQLARNYIPALYVSNSYYKNIILDTEKFRERTINEQIDILLIHIFDFENKTGQDNNHHLKNQKIVSNGKSLKRFGKVKDKELICNIISFIWTDYKSHWWNQFNQAIESYFNEQVMPPQELNVLEQNIIELTFRLRMIRASTDTAEQAYSKFSKIVGIPQIDDKLNVEKTFILSLLGIANKTFGIANNASKLYNESMLTLQKLGTDYYPAKYLSIASCTNRILDDAGFRNKNYWEQIRFILLHIFDFE